MINIILNAWPVWGDSPSRAEMCIVSFTPEKARELIRLYKWFLEKEKEQPDLRRVMLTTFDVEPIFYQGHASGNVLDKYLGVKVTDSADITRLPKDFVPPDEDRIQTSYDQLVIDDWGISWRSGVKYDSDLETALLDSRDLNWLIQVDEQGD